MKTKGDGSTGIEVPNCTYSRLKAEKQTRVKSDGVLQDNHEPSETQQLVDSFVQVSLTFLYHNYSLYFIPFFSELFLKLYR